VIGRQAVIEAAMVSIYPHSTPVRRSLESVEDWQVRANLPTMYDLPSEDPEKPGLPDEYHDLQSQLLSCTLNLAQYTRSEWFAASDLNLYYDANHQKWYSVQTGFWLLVCLACTMGKTCAGATALSIFMKYT